MATLMQISATTGPAEWCLGVVKLLAHLEARAAASKLALTLVEEVRVGTILWVCQSPLRPQHRRKNWYLDVTLFAEPARDFSSEVRLETMRSSGPGGQHANKTETAVRATHIATGLSVKIGGSRSQSANKAAALALLGAKVREQIDRASGEDKAQRRLRHCSKASQAVAKRFVGSDFRPDD